jgi:hypothetical protein
MTRMRLRVRQEHVGAAYFQPVRRRAFRRHERRRNTHTVADRKSHSPLRKKGKRHLGSTPGGCVEPGVGQSVHEGGKGRDLTELSNGKMSCR